MEVGGININCRLSPAAYIQLINSVPAELREKIKRCVSARDALKLLFSEVLARALICKNTGWNNAGIELARNDYGKPYVKGAAGLHFNISRAGDWVVCALDHRPVGIDIEKIRPFDPGVARYFLSAGEYSRLLHKPRAVKDDLFFHCGPAKKAI